MHRNKPADKTWNEWFKQLDGDALDQWVKAYREIDALLFENRPGAPHEGLSRQEPSDHDQINARLEVLVDIVQNARSPAKWKYRTRFGDKRLPCDLCTQNRYSKLHPQENLAVLYRLFGCNEKRGDLEERLDELEVDCDGDENLYLRLHSYPLDAQTAEKHDVRAALKAHFSKGEWDEGEVNHVSLRLFRSAEAGDAKRAHESEREEWKRLLKTLKRDTAALERMRSEFKAECHRVTPLFRVLEGQFNMDSGDGPSSGSKRKRSADLSESESAGESDQEFVESEDGAHSDTDSENESGNGDSGGLAGKQGFDNFFLKLKTAQGTNPPRLNAFKGDIEEHSIELVYSVCFACDWKDRLPKVKAPTFSEGADLVWLKEESGHGHLCKFKKPKEADSWDKVERGTCIKRKLNSMPPEEAKPITDAYLTLQTMARKLNRATNELFEFVRSAFQMTICLHIAGGEFDGAVYQYDNNISLAQELCLFHVYMNAIYKIPEHNPDHDEAVARADEEAEREAREAAAANDSSSGESASESEFEPSSGDDDDDDVDDDDDDDSGSGSGDDSGSGSGSDSGSDSGDDDGADDGVAAI